jgi:hypothetical protein
MRLPMAESMESRIFTRAGANFNKGGLAVKYLRERERESNKIIEMTKNIGHYSCNFGIY